METEAENHTGGKLFILGILQEEHQISHQLPLENKERSCLSSCKKFNKFNNFLLIVYYTK